MPGEENSPGPEAVQSGSYYKGNTNLPEYTWHLGVHNLIMDNYIDIVQHVLHHNSLTILTLCSYLSPIGFALQRYTFSSVLGPPEPDSRKVHF